MIIYKHIIPILLLMITAVGSYCETITFQEIAREAKARFNSFVNDESVMEYTIDLYGGNLNTVTVSKKGSKLRVESRFSPPNAQLINQVLIYDGKTKKVLQKTVDRTIKSEFNFASSNLDMLFYKVFKDWWDLNQEGVKITGSEKIGEKDCYVIEFGKLFPYVESYKVWVDVKTLLLVKEERANKAMTDKIDEKSKRLFEKVKTRKFLDYRKVSANWSIPDLVETYVDEKVIQSEKIISFNLNPDIPDIVFIEEVSKFVPPAGFNNNFPPMNNSPLQKVQEVEPDIPMPVFTREENAVLSFSVDAGLTVFTTRNPSTFPVSGTGLTILNTSSEKYKGLISGACKINDNDFVINFKKPTYISKIIFKSEGKPIYNDLSAAVYFNLGINVSYLDKDSGFKALASFNPIGKSYYDLSIQDFVKQIKVKNTHPEARLKDSMNLFHCILFGISKIELNCIAGKKPADKNAKTGPGISEEKKKEAEETLKTIPPDEKITKEILPGLIEKAKTGFINKDRKNNIDMEFIGSLDIEWNKTKSFTRLDGKIYKGGDKEKWDIYLTPSGQATTNFSFVNNYSTGKTFTCVAQDVMIDKTDLLLNWWESPGLEIIKTEKYEETDCYLIRGQEDANKYSFFWLDKENNRLLGVKRESEDETKMKIKDEVKYIYKKIKKQDFELPYLIKKTHINGLNKTELRIFIKNRYITEPNDALFDEKTDVMRDKLTQLKCMAINKRNKIEDERDAELEKYKEDLKSFTGKRAISRKFSDAITGFSFIVPEDFSRSIYYYNIFRYRPVKNTLNKKEIEEGDGNISIHKSYTSESIDKVLVSYKEGFLKKHPGAKFDDRTRMKIRNTDAAVVKIEYNNEDGETVKSRDMLFKIKNTLVNINFEYELLSEEKADKYQKNMLSTVAIGDSTRVAHSFFSPKLEEVYKLKAENKFTEMEKVIDAELGKNTNDAEMQFLKAVLLAKKGENDGAIVALKTAFENGYCDFAAIFREKDFEKLVEGKQLDFLLNDKEKLYATGRKNLLAAIRKELASYYEIRLDANNIVIFTDIKEKDYIEQVKNFTEALGNYEKSHMGFENTPFTVIWVFSEKEDVNNAMIGMLSGSEGYFSGLFVPSSGILLTDIYSGIGVYSHEYTHALHLGNANKNNQAHPLWFTEMLSTINEEVEYDAGNKIVKMNIKGDRYESMLDGIANDKIISIEKLITMDDKELMDSKNIEMFYAEVRYLGLFLQQKGIKNIYSQYIKDYATDRTGKTTIEKTFRIKMEMFQKDWENWVVNIPDKTK